MVGKKLGLVGMELLYMHLANEGGNWVNLGLCLCSLHRTLLGKLPLF